MKKIIYPLVAVLILCLVGIGMLLSARVGDRNEIARLEQEVAALVEERATWDAQKAQVSKSLSGVRGVLVKTLVDLEEVSSSLGTAMDTISEGPASGTVVPEASPLATAAPTAAPTKAAPEVTPSPSPTPQSTPAATVKPIVAGASEKPEAAATEAAEPTATATPAPQGTEKP